MNKGELFETSLRKILKGKLETPSLDPVDLEQRGKIVETAKNCLGFTDDLIPAMKYRQTGVSGGDGYKVEHLIFSSWANVAGAANLYLPESQKNEKPLPWVLLCCGHGGGCKLNPVYQAMAQHLARNGIAVLVPDNIGQSERIAMGHRNEPAPFVAGLCLQTLILYEDCAHIKAALKDSRFEPGKLGAIGNSGGGLATCFLSILADELSVIVSSGYPSTFEFIARKEKAHCCCNILPGIIGRLEMYQIYGCFAPKPLFLFQGNEDHYFPQDLFRSTARRVGAAYRNAPENLVTEVVPGGHSWDEHRIKISAEFLCLRLDLPTPASAVKMNDNLIDKRNIDQWRDKYLSTKELVRFLTGIDCKIESIYEIFPSAQDIDDDTSRAFYAQTKLFTEVNNFQAY